MQPNTEAEPSRRDTSIYLLPEELVPSEANEKARPSESPAEHEARVTEMRESIRANGQKYPVLVVETHGINSVGEGYVQYQYVDGGCRVEAIADLNRFYCENHPKPVWCSILEPGVDALRTALVGNLHRHGNNAWQMALIVAEVRRVNGWEGRGGGVKVARYLGLLPSRVAEYTKLLGAPDSLRQQIIAGKIQSLEAAMKVMSRLRAGDVTPEQVDAVVSRAAELAADEVEDSPPEDSALEDSVLEDSTLVEVADVEPVAVESDEMGDAADTADTPAGTIPAAGACAAGSEVSRSPEEAPEAPPIKGRHIDQALREQGARAHRGKNDIVQFFGLVTESAYHPAVVAFTDYFTATWLRGQGSNAELLELFDRAVIPMGSHLRGNAGVAPAKKGRVRK